MKCLASLFLISLGLAYATPADPPVTKIEASAVFAKAEQVIKDVLQVKTSTTAFATGPGVATRDQIAKRFATLLEAVQPKFKFLPPRLKSVPAIMTLTDKSSAERLITLGFIDRYGPLATSKSPGLSPQEFGDALGFFITRVAELTHTPSTKFSPYLTPP